MPDQRPDPSPQSREIGVSISSTFRDLRAERDHLVKFVFPELRRLCESRGVTWGEVDLRWGVTDEQAAEGKVLPICLEEIRRCRPWFIGLLGERYGWVPDLIPQELTEREPWLNEHLHHSVTELEILHGVLRDPKMAGQAFFYFRDPAYVDALPPEQRLAFVEEPTPEETARFGEVEAAWRADERRVNLAALKDQIRRMARDGEIRFPPRENYPNPKALGEMVLRDLTEVINKLYPEGSQPDPLDREAMDHEAYAQSRERVYIGRPEYFARLDAHTGGTGDQPLVVLGESGSGKSALLANWAARYRREHPDALVLQHYIGASPYSADWAAMLRRIMGEFKRRLGIQLEIPDNPDALRSAFPNWLHMASAACTPPSAGGEGRGERATRPSGSVLILDALNQLEDRDGAPDLVWLPPVMPEKVRLIVSTLPGRPLDEIRKRRWPEMNVKPLEAAERMQLVEEYLSRSAKHLGTGQLSRIADAPQSANPLYLRVLLDELRIFGRHEELDRRIGHYLQAESPYELYEKVIVRWEQDYEGDSDLVGDTLSLLWAARRGLSESELLQTLGADREPLPRAAWSPLFLAMSDGLVSRGGLLTFAHEFLRTAARDAYVPGESHQRQAHLRLADYFERLPASPRRTDELPWQLAEARAWERLRALLTDRDLFVDAWDRNQFEVKTCWTQIEAGSSLRMVDAYRSLIDHPETEPDKVFLSRLDILLNDTGHSEEGFSLRSALVAHCRATGDLSNLSVILNSQALILKVRGDLDGAMAMHKEAEQLCRQLGNLDSLAIGLGNQASILYTRGDMDGAMALHEEAERIFRQLGNLDSLSSILGNQALILILQGDLARAMALLKEDERICRQSGNLGGLQSALCKQASILSDRGDLDGAIALLKEGERICRQLGNLDGLQSTLGNQATILQARGDLDGAMVLHKEEERIGRQLGDLDSLSISLSNQALILKARGDLDGAMALFKEQERICRQLGNLHSLAIGLGNQARILHDHGDLKGAMALHKKEERIGRQLGNPKGLGRTLGSQALILKARGDLDGAMALHKEEERISRQLGNLSSLSVSLGNQARILLDRGDLNGAMALHKEEERISRQLGDLDGLQSTLCDQARIIYLRGDLAGAMALWQEQERICRELGNPDRLARALSNQASILCIRGDLDEAMALYKGQEQTWRQLGKVEELAMSLANQAEALRRMGRARDGLSLAEEAYRLAQTHGYAALVGQIEPILDAVRQAAGED